MVAGAIPKPTTLGSRRSYPLHLDVDRPLASPETAPMTGEELCALGNVGRSELVKGKLIRMAPTGFPHGLIETRLGKVLSIFVDSHKLGYVLSGEVGIYTTRDPDTVRGADVVFISADRLAQVRSQSYLDVAPELIAEILSPDDRWSEVMEKLEEYFKIGVLMVWVVDYRRRQIHVYRSMTRVEQLTVEDDLTGGDLLPGFRVSVAEILGEVTEARP